MEEFCGIFSSFVIFEADFWNNREDSSRVISGFPNSAKHTPQSSFLLDFPRKIQFSEVSNFSRKSSRKLYQKPQIPKTKTSFGLKKQKRAKKKFAKEKDNAIDLRFMNSDLESDFSIKNSVKATSNVDSSFQIGGSRGRKRDPAETSKIQKEFEKNFPGHGNMSPTSKFQNTFFARKSE